MTRAQIVGVVVALVVVAVAAFLIGQSGMWGGQVIKIFTPAP